MKISTFNLWKKDQGADFYLVKRILKLLEIKFIVLDRPARYPRELSLTFLNFQVVIKW